MGTAYVKVGESKRTIVAKSVNFLRNTVLDLTFNEP